MRLCLVPSAASSVTTVSHASRLPSTVAHIGLLRLLAVRRVRRAVRLLRLLAVGYAEPLCVERRRTAAYDVYVRNVRLVGRSLTNFFLAVVF